MRQNFPKWCSGNSTILIIGAAANKLTGSLLSINRKNKEFQITLVASIRLAYCNKQRNTLKCASLALEVLWGSIHVLLSVRWSIAVRLSIDVSAWHSACQLLVTPDDRSGTDRPMGALFDLLSSSSIPALSSSTTSPQPSVSPLLS